MDTKDLSSSPIGPGFNWPAPTSKRKVLTSLSELSTNPDTTFIVSDNLTHSGGTLLPVSIKIANNVTLIFQGGCLYSLNSELILTGNDTKVFAPISQIFYGNVTVNGNWITDRVYPQWFDEKVGKDAKNTTSPYDCSTAINKAIRMKLTGEVFLTQGNYFISKPIKLSHGIQLCGEYLNKETDAATRIIPFIGTTDGFVSTLNSNNSSPIFQINVQEVSEDKYTWQTSYPDPSGALKNLYIGNDKNNILLSKKVCCLVAGGYTFENLHIHNFYNAVKWTKDYADSKRIIHCQFTFDRQLKKDISNPEVTYLMDMGETGDAMEIRDTTTDWNTNAHGNNYKGLIVRDCQGGTVSNCILNTDVIFQCISSMVFEANHLESGAQLKIVRSDMSVRNNYFEKGTRPSVVFDLRIDDTNVNEEANVYNQVQMSGNIFVFLAPKDLYLKDENDKYKEIDENGRTPIKSVCPYDIAFCAQRNSPHLIKMSENYRITRHGSIANQPTGIKMAYFSTNSETGLTDFYEFNNHSYFLSTECSILPRGRVSATRHFGSIPTVKLTLQTNEKITVPPDINLSTESKWPHSYRAQAFFDVPRQIGGSSIEIECKGYKQPEDQKNGVLIVIDINTPTNESCFILRMTRTPSTTSGYTYDMVDVPIIGTRFLYDNYYSVNGYPWQPKNGSPILPAYTPAVVETITFKDLNVDISALSQPIYMGGWRNNDKVFNSGTTTTPVLWYFRNNAWISK